MPQSVGALGFVSARGFGAATRRSLRRRPARDRSEPHAIAGLARRYPAPVTQLPNLRVGVSAAGAHLLVRLDGELDIASSNLLARRLSGLLSREHPRIVVDLAGLKFCDAAGLGAFVKVSRLAAARGGWLRMSAARPRMLRLMLITGLSGTLPEYETVHDALAGSMKCHARATTLRHPAPDAVAAAAREPDDEDLCDHGGVASAS
ncbi:STAS domain-containing protein [Actinocrinis puniceicyclus]|uniref:Anti-sigma factor antagonist n=1 Tax=Actinocrinis puniceicyclus TaxID=977794 RepID=A0A8J7WQC4_9ACTN|nr:STAS domain-containing protein [Actinocrinis puniceicyclus]MBS2964865.1 STAS domain-containing protein [Actinocrinis puniceicyclus]